MALALRKEEEIYTFADFLAWDEDVRAEIIDGEVWMQAAPLTEHQLVSMSLSAQLYQYLRGKTCRVVSAPFAVRLFEKEGDRPEDVKTVVQPDIAVICDRAKIDRIGCKGAPDLVIEILSPSNRRHDQIKKMDLYWRAGVREYWIVDPEEKTVLTYRWNEAGYVFAGGGTETDHIKVGILDDCEIDLAEAFSGAEAAAPADEGGGEKE